MDWKEYIIGMMGAVIGSCVTALGMGSRIKAVEKDCDELKVDMQKKHDDLKTDTLKMFHEIRKDVKKLIAKTAERRVRD